MSALLLSAALTCTVEGPTLRTAREAFAQNCPTSVRADCDPVGNDWQCSSEKIGRYAPRFTVPAEVTTVAEDTDLVCTVEASTLAAAREAFVEVCPFLVREDCDPVGEAWQCSNREIEPNAAIQEEVLIVRPGVDLDEPAQEAEPLISGECSVTADTLSAARSLYELTCSDVRQDCDKTGDTWMCASYTMEDVVTDPINTATDEPGGGDEPETEAGESEPTPEPTTTNLVSTGIDSPITPRGLSWADSYMDSTGRCWISSTFDHGIGQERVTVASGRTITVRQARIELGPGPGRHNDLAFNDVQCGHGPANDFGDEDINQCPGLVTRGRAGCSLRAADGLWTDRL